MKDINVINKMQLMEDPKLAIQLQQALDQMTKYLKALKTRFSLQVSTKLPVTITLWETTEAKTLQSMLL